MTPQYPDVTVALVGEDGNAFGIIARVSKALEREHGTQVAANFVAEAVAAESYDDLLRLVMATVEVE